MHHEQIAPAQLEAIDEIQSFPADESRTPSKPRKKVRFSEPCTDIAGTASTGLTPAFNRTSFAPYRQQPTPVIGSDRRPKRLASLPDLRVDATTSLRRSASPASATISGEVQIVPWSDVMDSRSKRRIKRNHLSEVQIQYEASKKPEGQLSLYEEEIKALKAELARLKKQQMHVETEGSSSALKGVNREKELVQEIDRLKQEMIDQAPNPSLHPPVTPSDATQPPTDRLIGDQAQHNQTESPLEPDDPLNFQAPIADTPTYINQSSQASFEDPKFDGTLRSARLNLEYLFPGEITLPLVPENARSLLDTMLERLNILRTRALIAEDAETTATMSEKNIRGQFNKTLEQLKRARHYAETVGSKAKENQETAANAEKKAKSFEKKIDAAANIVHGLQSNNEEKDRSIIKLQEALDSYRAEVGKLETFIMNMDKGHDADKSKLKLDMDEAIADLECHVTAETAGRREAEQALEQKDQKIKELQVRERELKRAVNEKQISLRNIETAFDKQSNAQNVLERENRLLTAQVDRLKHNVQSSDHRYEQADKTCEILSQKLREERASAMRALSAVQDEVAQLSKNTGGIQSAHAEDSKKRSSDVLEHKGLLTPTTGGRFRDGDEIGDMEGVEIQRGKKTKGIRKKRPDSGIVILEEDEDEDEEMTEF